MGSSVSKIGCKREGGYAGGGGSGRHHKRKTNTVDKTSIGIPTGFRVHHPTIFLKSTYTAH